jgi:2-succinyl-6-hydroxy-2,4-cyclohexadiene-1-carboxylate synthase
MRTVALHGFTGSGADWSPYAPDLAPDLIGHGDAPAPSDVASYTLGAELPRLHERVGRGPIALLGYSLGGRVALRLAPLLGDQLHALVLISASPGIVSPTERAARRTRDEALATAIETRGMAWFVDHWRKHPVIQSQDAIPDALRTPMQARRACNRATGLANSLRGIGQGSVEPVWEALPAIQVPTLWVTGANDVAYTDMAARARTLMPNAEHLVVPGVGHCTHLEALSTVRPAIEDFLERVSSARGTR